MPQTPEQKARQQIDAQLEAAGWKVQDRDSLELTAGRGIAVREFNLKTGFGFADYLLYIDRKAAGALEAKAEGPLTGVEAQSAKYSYGLPENLRAWRRPLPFLFESNGSIAQFTNGLDPVPRSRQIFHLPRPEALAELLEQPQSLRHLLREMPPLDETGLWRVQADTIRKLEQSFAHGRPRALIQMATGSGKTFTAVNACYRLLRHAKARRILFLVDRSNLGIQTEGEFRDFTAPDDGRKFPDLYPIQRLQGNQINSATKVVITTIQRLYSILKGDPEFDPENEVGSGFDTARPWNGPPPQVEYNPGLPPEFFDFIVVDECHRSIYDLWSQVLLYFDAFLVGLTATPSKRTLAFFQQNMVQDYGHEEAVVDGVNVDYDVYRIRTRVTEQGATIEMPDDELLYVEKRHKLTRAERLEQLDQDFTYTANQLDRDVVAESQIRTVLQAFRQRVLPHAFRERGEVPKTLIFAKDDSHADDIVRIAREVFDEGNDFCQKITYRTGFTRRTQRVVHEDGTESEITDWVRTSSLSAEEILNNFRTSFFPRIAVTVDMIATGTDVKPIEVVFFLRNVKSTGLFEQMKGRGVRVISVDKLRGVTPSARQAKERFLVVDAVGICEHSLTEAQSLNRQPTVPLPRLLEYVAQGGLDQDALLTLAGRLARLQRELTPAQIAELQELASGHGLSDLARSLIHACNPDRQIEAAQERFATGEPTPEQIAQVAEDLAQEAVTPFLKAAFRRRILEIRQQNEQTMDRHTVDELLYAGIDAASVEKAETRVQVFRRWLQENREELTALQVIHSGTRPLRLSLRDLRQLRDALSRPPLAATPQQLWRAFEVVEGTASSEETAERRGGEVLTDLVALVRHALIPGFSLVPYTQEVQGRYAEWRASQAQAGRTFTPEQSEWLDRMAEHIATSLS
ncbi:MAG TPA: DEAD/DEAH box helicase family protein, partial [Thermoanaerobaculia bacterium]|nr:DEAD/DEAH box helicase family protein [Thermoanaerobaculia bacterium]